MLRAEREERVCNNSRSMDCEVKSKSIDEFI